RTHEANDFARFHRQRYTVDGQQIAETMADIFEIEALVFQGHLPLYPARIKTQPGVRTRDRSGGGS
ncbi:MAG: hypothetical protein ACI8S3_002453, partial [Alphaproteobacteria bacterium]